MSKELERLGAEGYARKIKYNNDYVKRSYRRITFSVPKEQKEELKELLEHNNMNNVDFLELGIRLVKREMKKNGR